MAAHLKVAAGTVRCGACGHVFDALASLIDELPQAVAGPEPPELNEIEAPAPPRIEVEVEPSLELSSGQPESIELDEEEEPNEPKANSADLDLPGADTVKASQEPLVDFASVEASDEAPAWDLDDDEDEISVVVADDEEVVSFEAHDAGSVEAVSEGAEPDVEEEMPLALRRTERQRRSRRLGWWAAGSIVLVLLVLLQLLWFRHGWVTSQLPTAKALVVPLCEALSCPQVKQPASQRDNPVRLFSRDVRYHPGLESTLLVNATLNNRGQAPEPFPVLELSLFDTNGDLIGMRRFQPRDYLDSSIDPAGAIEPGQPVHIVLEIAATEQAAVSFEFRFL